MEAFVIEALEKLNEKERVVCNRCGEINNIEIHKELREIYVPVDESGNPCDVRWVNGIVPVPKDFHHYEPNVSPGRVEYKCGGCRYPLDPVAAKRYLKLLGDILNLSSASQEKWLP